MASKLGISVGTENKRNVIIAGVLFCVLGYLVIRQFMGDSPKPAPVVSTVKAPPALRTTTGTGTAGTTVIRNTVVTPTAGPEAHKVANTGLDPSLHLERLLLSESIEYAGSGRNIFSADSAPVAVEQAAAPARPDPAIEAANAAPVIPAPPAIDLRYFGYSANKEGKRQAFLLRGEDIFEASVGEIVNHRYKVVTVEPRSVQVTDLSYNNTQTLPLTAN
jgi:hypothetical protein